MLKAKADRALSLGTGLCLLLERSYAGNEFPGNHPTENGAACDIAQACSGEQGCHQLFYPQPLRNPQFRYGNQPEGLAGTRHLVDAVSRPGFTELGWDISVC